MLNGAATTVDWSRSSAPALRLKEVRVQQRVIEHTSDVANLQERAGE